MELVGAPLKHPAPRGVAPQNLFIHWHHTCVECLLFVSEQISPVELHPGGGRTFQWMKTGSPGGAGNQPCLAEQEESVGTTPVTLPLGPGSQRSSGFDDDEMLRSANRLGVGWY